MIQFDLPKEHSSIIKVIGVGGGGSNAVNYMFAQNIEGVNFVICNTDAQAIAQSKVPNKVQLGPHLTQGLGAGANPEIGRQATEESLEEIRRILEVNTKMVFITAGMGGGTGTGGAPIVAKICRDLGILTVGIVTTPFSYEGKKRISQAEEGINKLKEYVDTLLVISNDKLRHQFGNLTMRAAFSKADNVLATAAKCITDVISSTGQINVDFADVCTVMRRGGVAILGSATASGENRAQRAIENALNSPLLNDNDIRGAKWILININSAEGENEFTMDEVEIIQNYLLQHAGQDSDVILGLGYDSNLEDKIGITLIATGFEHRDPFEGTMMPKASEKKDEDQKIVMTLGIEGEEKKMYGQPPLPFEDKDPLAPRLVSPVSNVPAVPAVSLKDTSVITEPTLTQAPQSSNPEVYVLSMDEKPELPIQEDPTVMVLRMEEEVTVSPTADLYAMSMKTEGEKPVQVTPETPAQVEFQPEIIEDLPVMRYTLKEEEISEKIEMLSLSSTPQVPVETKPSETVDTVLSTTDIVEKNKEASTTLTSGGFLAKPSNIYAEEPIDLKSDQESFEDLVTKGSVEEDGPIFDMQLVIKEPKAVDEPGTPPIHATLGSVEEPAMQDEAEDQKRKAAERLHKLRNLSFNVNAADPNNEFESVPAYIRRNLEVHNTALTSIEKFYSNYTVKSDENNQGQISTINTFLEGKKPD
jgi:cell division protein FtsZ